MNIKKWIAAGCLLLAFVRLPGQSSTNSYKEQYRPQLHFSPQQHWINDPNGMVFFKGTYHLFFQYYPYGITWGPMHWGHAISKDMVHWKELPIALYPDSLGFIFSGSAVVDSNNTSGFGSKGKTPLVAIFTHHDPKGEKAGKENFQNQSLAYSLDGGYSWTKYTGNPVLKNPGIRDFRDPKVIWYPTKKKWVMTLATKDRITFYSSPNLKEWKKESEFGKRIGAHNGVWECPDLFTLRLNGKIYWILTVNLNPGGPNGGSATQYFVGKFDGSTFTPISDVTKWVDYGPDEYAGVTWSNTGSRKIFLGWMTNWDYASQVPTEKWRNAMTIPRELALTEIDGQIRLTSNPVTELMKLAQPAMDVASGFAKLPGQYILKFDKPKAENYQIILSNGQGEQLVIGCDKKGYYINRSRSGKVNFNPGFAKIAVAPRFANAKSRDIKLVVDRSSVELFADGGATIMTGIFFPSRPYNRIELKSIKQVRITPLRSIW